MTSFDIFDTLLTRTVWKPFGIFLLVQRELMETGVKYPVSHYVKENYALLRKNAEEHARRANRYAGGEEVTLDEIYRCMSQMAHLSEEELRELKNLEIQTELKNSVPIPENIQLLQECLNRKEDVILISDMYLPKEVIRELLVQADPILGKLPLYVSSEYGKTKRSGALYLQAKEELHISYAEWSHYGDNLFSDVNIPKKMGIKAVQIQWGENAFSQRLIKEKALYEDATGQIFLGASKNTIKNHSLKNAGMIGASVGGCLLYPYVDWVVHTSLELGYNRLFFVARDGFVLKKIADEIILANQYKLTTKYLFGSRKAWRVDTEKEKTLLKKYLMQEIGIVDDKFALVDLQGTGCSMEYLSNILGQEKTFCLNVFYYQLFYGKENSNCNFMPFTILEDNIFIETFARAPHGVTLGYEEKDGRIFPVLAKTDMNIWERHGLPDYLRGVEAFSKELAWTLKKLKMHGDSLKLASYVIRYAQESFDQELLQFVGDLPHNDSSDDLKYLFAPKLSKKDIYRIYMWRTTESIQEVYKGNHLPFSEKRMSIQDERQKEFYVRHYYDGLGSAIHRFKYIARKKKAVKGFGRIIIYAAGDKGKWLYQFITYETKSRVVGWADINYQELQEKGMPVVSLSEALKNEYDVIVIALNNADACKRLEDEFVSIGIHKDKIMCMEEFCRMVCK